jgi:two-component system, NarL family, nitrate/nitrite response regulator NarL
VTGSSGTAPAAEPERVVIADDHAPTRRLVARALTEASFLVVAQATDADEAVDAALEHRPAACLLDISMPKGGGIEAARRICGDLPSTAVVMHTISEDNRDLLEALRAGASGYLLKTMDPNLIGRSLRAVMAGESTIPRHLTAQLIADYDTGRTRRVVNATGQPVQLSTREWEVLEMLRAGLSTADIADRTYVAPVTVRSHVSSLLRKLRVDSRDEAVRLLSA